jgi:hypothetical protein
MSAAISWFPLRPFLLAERVAALVLLTFFVGIASLSSAPAGESRRKILDTASVEERRLAAPMRN